MSLDLLRAVHARPGPWGFFRRQVLRSYARMVEWSTKLHRRTLNLSRVSGYLFVGGHVPRVHYRRLAALGITAVVDLRAERQDDSRALTALGIEYVNLPAPDHFAPSRAQLEEGVNWMLSRVERGGRVFVHCEHGVGRGPLMGLCLMVALGESPDAAYRTLRGQRWQATLNDRQLEALADFAEQLPRTQTSNLPATGTPGQGEE